MAVLNSPTAQLVDVQATVNAAVDGDTVTVPSTTGLSGGVATWSGGLYVGRAITLTGAGVGVTVIKGNNPNWYMIGYGAENRSATFEMSGFTFDGQQTTSHLILDSNVNGHSSVPVRYVIIHNCRFINSAAAGLPNVRG